MGLQDDTRRSWDIEATGSVYGSTAHLFLGLVGIGGILAFLGLLLFILLTVGTVLFGRSFAGQKMESWGTPKTLGNLSAQDGSAVIEAHPTQGTMVLAIIFLACFAVYYFANWKALADAWPVR